MKDFIEDYKGDILFMWGILMTVVTIIAITYAIVITDISKDLTTTISFKDKDIQDMQDHINKLTEDLNQLKLAKKGVDSDLTKCVQELQGK